MHHSPCSHLDNLQHYCTIFLLLFQSCQICRRVNTPYWSTIDVQKYYCMNTPSAEIFRRHSIQKISMFVEMLGALTYKAMEILNLRRLEFIISFWQTRRALREHIRQYSEGI